MKINIGPYKNWFGPYQLADLLQYLGLKEETCYLIGEKLSKTFIANICEYIYSKRKRKIKVKIHVYDIWNLDHTLSLIILPCLLKIKEEEVDYSTLIAVTSAILIGICIIFGS